MDMTVSLTEYLHTMVNAKVVSGLYDSPSEVVREALRLLDEKDRLRVAKLSAASTAVGPDGEPIQRHGRGAKAAG